jgi:hypothetical protein
MGDCVFALPGRIIFPTRFLQTTFWMNSTGAPEASGLNRGDAKGEFGSFMM